MRLCEAAAEKSRQPVRTDKACLPLWDRLLSLWTLGAVPDCMVIANAIPFIGLSREMMRGAYPFMALENLSTLQLVQPMQPRTGQL